ncbi:MAG TPA: PLP-dependent aspartate aminotransferase family protein [Ktedonobacteraceae bacterium]|nr:PLP-dependent aspartate aminotransferase family protein [Ktedonobacteraceae bacterium]
MKEETTPPWTLDTLLVHGGTGNQPTIDSGVPSVQPIYTSSTYLHASTEALEAAFSGTTAAGEPAYVYARQGNPNANAFEQVMARAEGGVGAVAFGSGMAAIHAALLAAGLAPGTKIVASRDLYGASIGLLRKMFVPMGIKVVLHNLHDEHAADRIRQEVPDIVFVESISNPLVKVIDVDIISAAAQEVGAVSIIDSTFTTPCLLRPIEHGFDLVIHSATKYLGGHGDSTLGVVISAKRALLDQLRAACTMMGAMAGPFELYLVVRGLRTLSLRMQRHCVNALQVARFLQQHPAVERVYYPGLPDHPQHELATRLLACAQYGGLLSFELKEQTRAAAFRFMDALRLCLPATTLGDTWTQVSYPPISSHRDLTASERQNMGITDGCIRLSVGIEDIGDIIRDLDQALGR